MKAEGVRFPKIYNSICPPSGKKSENLGSWPMDYGEGLGVGVGVGKTHISEIGQDLIT